MLIRRVETEFLCGTGQSVRLDRFVQSRALSHPLHGNLSEWPTHRPREVLGTKRKLVLRRKRARAGDRSRHIYIVIH